ncbi:MAG: hypothetical protein ACFFDI_30945 [Promethearchaeota archaeon]
MGRYWSFVRGLFVAFFATLFVIFGVILLGSVLGMTIELILLLSPLFFFLNWFLYLKLPGTEPQQQEEKES